MTWSRVHSRIDRIWIDGRVGMDIKLDDNSLSQNRQFADRLFCISAKAPDNPSTWWYSMQKHSAWKSYCIRDGQIQEPDSLFFYVFQVSSSETIFVFLQASILRDYETINVLQRIVIPLKYLRDRPRPSTRPNTQLFALRKCSNPSLSSSSIICIRRRSTISITTPYLVGVDPRCDGTRDFCDGVFVQFR